MCGICGIVERADRSVDRELLSRMTRSLSHRGPDDEGSFIGGYIGLGHRRLSIIDVKSGGQPISNEDGTLQLVFNGEIYNFVELRQELERFGHKFETHSDTEVIVHAYEQWGEDCVQRFNGMFAFALWDPKKQQVFIARDHVGVKPLYYCQVAGRLLFASEIKALLQDREFPREVDHNALADLLTLRFVPSPRTLFKGIFKLPPGHSMTVRNGKVEIRRFWNWVPRFRDASEAELIEEYQSLLQDAVKLQLRSDVPLGLFLSSGVDSAALLAIMRQHTGSPVKAFTIGFTDGEKSNEVDDAKALATMFGAEHHHMMVRPEDYMAYYERYMWDLEEPVGNESAAAFYFVSKITSEQVKVALTGQGADEPWAGYHRYMGVRFSDWYSRLPGFVTNRMVPALASMLPRSERFKRGTASLSERNVLLRFAKIYSFFNTDMKAALYQDWFRQQVPDYKFGDLGAIGGLQSRVQHLDPLTQMLFIDTRANLPDDLLMVGDKMSMANSLEARVPFLDYRLIEFIETMPPAMKLRGTQGKYLHKKALQKWLPKEVVYRRKKGFENPVEYWLRGRMKSFVEDALLGEDSCIGQFFNRSYVEQILRKHETRRESYMRQIYLLLSLELWHRTFIRSVPSAPDRPACATAA